MKTFCERIWSSVEEWLQIGNVDDDETDNAEVPEMESHSHITTVLGNGWE